MNHDPIQQQALARAQQLNAQLNQLYRAGQFTQALDVAHQVCSIFEEHLGFEDAETATSFNNIGAIYESLGKYDLALDFHTKALKIYEKILGIEHPHTASSYNNIGSLLDSLGNYDLALDFYNKALTIFEKVLGLEHPHTLSINNNIGLLHMSMGNFDLALDFYNKALNIKEKTLGLEHPSTAISYNNIGLLHNSMGNYDLALKFHTKALAILEKKLGSEHPDTASCYNNIGAPLKSMGNYDLALDFYNKALNIREKILGLEHPDTAQSYNNIGLLHQSMGNYGLALDFYNKALTIREKTLGLEHPDTATSYNNIGLLHQSMGNYDLALDFYTKALSICEKTLGLEHPDTARSYNNVGALHKSMGNYDLALDFFTKALSIYEKILGLEHPSTAISYNNIGALRQSMGNYDLALDFYNEALTIYEKILGFEHPDTATSYNNIGALHESMGNYDLALDFYNKALTIREKILGLEHPDSAGSYNNLAQLYLRTHDASQAYHYAQKAFSITVTQRERNFKVLDHAQKQKLASASLFAASLLLHTAHALIEAEPARRDEVQAFVARAWFNDKAAAYASENAVLLLKAHNTDPLVQALLDNKIKQDEAYAQLMQKTFDYGATEVEMAEYRAQVERCQQALSALEVQLSQHSAVYAEEMGLRQIGIEQVQQGLMPEQLWLDFAYLNHRYYVFTLSDVGALHFTALDETVSRKIDTAVLAFKRQFAELEVHQSQLTLSALYRALLEPIALHINSAKSLLISPDGPLRQLPFEALFNADTQQYLIQTHSISYMPSAREWVRLQGHSSIRSESNQAALFYNPDFESEIPVEPNQEAGQRRGLQSALSELPGTWGRVPHTQVEGEQIGLVLESKYCVDRYEDEHFNKHNLLSVQQPKLLHIATHGYFLDSATQPNPMLNAGLVLSGYNTSNDRQHFIASALTLSAMNLKGTDLVVLSACDTGVIDDNRAESVSALNKAFIQAGCKNIVMALWQIPDSETADVMVAFYQEMAQREDRSQALRESKLKLIEENKHPFYWAGLVMSGNGQWHELAPQLELEPHIMNKSKPIWSRIMSWLSRLF